MRAAAVLLALLALNGCSSRSWFEGMKEGARQQCQQTPDAGEARRCAEEVNRRKYDDYERERPK